MGYTGSTVEVPLGGFGVRSDDPELSLQPGELTDAKNVDLSEGIIQTSLGSSRWNQTALDSPPVLAQDWYPQEAMQRVIVLCANGKLYKFKNAYRVTEITPYYTVTSAQLTPGQHPHFVAGGKLSKSENRKLFLFTGSNPIMVMEGDMTTYRPINFPLSDWGTNNYPTFGCIFRNRLVTLGTPEDPHLVVMSSATDQEKFDDINAIIAIRVFPGEGERLITAWAFRGKLFVFKYPTGVYTLEDTDADPDNWYFKKVAATVGAASAHSCAEEVNDLIVGNQMGTLSSMAAAFQLGDIKMSDVTANIRVEKYFSNNFDNAELQARWGIYHTLKRAFYFSFKSVSGNNIDRLALIDLSNNQAKISQITKDTLFSLFKMRGNENREVPAYCGLDNYIYTMDSMTHAVNLSTGYVSEFHTPQFDFGKDQAKLFDFLEIEAEHTGLWPLYCDVFLEDHFSETLTFQLSGKSVLAANQPDPNCFKLDTDRLVGRQTRAQRKKLHGRGRTISVRFYTSGILGQWFKLSKVTFFVRMGNEDERKN